MTRPNHILQVVHSLAVGGTERVVCDLARTFNDAEFRTSVCCLDGLGELGEGLRREGIKVHVLGRKPGLDLSLFSRVRALYRQEGVDLVHAHQYTPYFYSATAALGARSVRVIFTEHGRHWPDRMRRKRVIVNKLLRATTFAYTAVSEFSRDCLVRYERIPADRIRVIYNGIAFNGKMEKVDVRRRVRGELGFEEDDLIVVSVGRLDRVKDFETLIRAFAYVSERMPKSCLWIVGGGDPVYRQELVLLSERLGLLDKVQFLGSRNDVNALLAASDLFALCSITEATSMTILEAMAAERAVVATMTGGNPEIVHHGATGLLVPVGNISSVARSILTLLQDTALRNSMGQAGRDRLEHRFRLKDKFQQYCDLYRDAMSATAGPEGAS